MEQNVTDVEMCCAYWSCCVYEMIADISVRSWFLYIYVCVCVLAGGFSLVSFCQEFIR